MKLISPEARADAHESTRAAVLVLLAIIVACFLRFPDRAVRPMHVDETTQAVKFSEILDGTYRYDPVDHHGPTLLYSTLPVLWFSDAESWSDMTESRLRLVPALYGIALILALIFVRDGICRMGLAWAAVALAVSPSLVFYSRYYIMEVLLVFFTFGAIACGWRFYMTRETGWLAAAGVCAGLMHATKETCVLVFAAMAVALGVVWLVELFSAGSGLGVVNRNRRRPVTRRHVIVFAACAAGTSILVFSKFLTDWRAVADSILTYFRMIGRAGGEGHEKPFAYYFSLIWGAPLVYDRAPFWSYAFWSHLPERLGITGGRRILWTEATVLFLAAIGIVSAFLSRPGRNQSQQLLRFLSVYSVACLLFYSVVSYKTPWCLLGPWHGLLILAGAGAAAFVRLFERRSTRIAAGVFLALLMSHQALLAYRASRTFAAEPRNPYNYSMTAVDCLNWVEKLHRFAQIDPKGYNLNILQFDSQGGWPLPWYLARRFPEYRWGNDGRDFDFATADVIFCEDEWRANLPPEVTDSDAKWPVFPVALHPARRLHVYVRPDLWKAYTAQPGWPEFRVQE